MLKLVPLGSCRDLPRGFWGCELDYDVDSGPPHWRWRYWIHVVLGISPAKWLASKTDCGIPDIQCFARLHQIHLASLKSSKHKKTKLRNHSRGEGHLRRHKHKRSKATGPTGAIFILITLNSNKMIKFLIKQFRLVSISEKVPLVSSFTWLLFRWRVSSVKLYI